MSHIDELIAKHCPDGVEFKELQELFVMKNGYTPSKTNNAFWADGTVPWFRTPGTHGLQSLGKGRSRPTYTRAT